MNIQKELLYNIDKPAVLSIQKDDQRQVFAVGLLRNQILPKHKTTQPALLIVQEGSIVFHMNGLSSPLKQFDIFLIPVGVEHEVVGTGERNFFLIIK